MNDRTTDECPLWRYAAPLHSCKYRWLHAPDLNPREAAAFQTPVARPAPAAPDSPRRAGNLSGCDPRVPSVLGGGRSWWAHLAFTGINIELTIGKKDIEETPPPRIPLAILACVRSRAGVSAIRHRRSDAINFTVPLDGESGPQPHPSFIEVSRPAPVRGGTREVAGSGEGCLDRLIPLGERHFRRALANFVVHYHRERNHQGLGNELIDGLERFSLRPAGCGAASEWVVSSVITIGPHSPTAQSARRNCWTLRGDVTP